MVDLIIKGVEGWFAYIHSCSLPQRKSEGRETTWIHHVKALFTDLSSRWTKKSHYSFHVAHRIRRLVTQDGQHEISEILIQRQQYHPDKTIKR